MEVKVLWSQFGDRGMNKSRLQKIKLLVRWPETYAEFYWILAGVPSIVTLKDLINLIQLKWLHIIHVLIYYFYIVVTLSKCNIFFKNQVIYVPIVLTLSFSHVMAPGTEKEVGGNKSCISESSSTNRHYVQEDA